MKKSNQNCLLEYFIFSFWNGRPKTEDQNAQLSISHQLYFASLCLLVIKRTIIFINYSWFGNSYFSTLKRQTILHFTFSILLFSCQNPTKDPILFELIPAERSGVTFENNLTSTDSLNILEYLYFYNGGGVAIGDINNDGLINEANFIQFMTKVFISDLDTRMRLTFNM